MNIKNYHEAVEALYPYLGQYLQEQGIDTRKHFSCINPAHDDSSPSCSLAPSGKAFHCFGCGTSGGIFNAAGFLEGKPTTGKEFVLENLIYLADKYGVELDHEPLTEEEVYELDTFRAYRAAAELINSSDKGVQFTEAITNRGWAESICREYGVGGIRDYKEFREGLKQLGFTATFLDDVDLGRKEIFGEDRLIFTIRDHHGRPVGFSSRNLGYTEDKQNGAKYVNQKSTGVKCNIYKKSTRLYGFDQVLQHRGKSTDPIYIFEGYADVVTTAGAGVWNCVGIGGLNLTAEQVFLLKEHNCYDIVLCLDGDQAGQDRTVDILDTLLSGHKDLRVRVINLPSDLDPDEFIRLHGADAFKKLKHWTAFEWRLARFNEDADSEEICRIMIPLIVNETSYITQEKQCRVLAKSTGITEKAVQRELLRLQDMKENKKVRERQTVIDKLANSLRKSPDEAEFAMHEAEDTLYDIARRYDEDAFSEESCLSFIEGQKNYEEGKDGSFSGFVLGPDLKTLQDALCGEWKKNVWLTFGGKPNSGKTSFLVKMTYEIARNVVDNDALVIYHTIDDTAEQVLPKFLAVAEGTRKLTLNEIMDPNYHANNRIEGQQDLIDRRETSYSIIKDLVRQGRIILKDANDGISIAYANSLIKYYKAKYPDRNIVYVLDNFHKLQDFSEGGGDERVRFKELSKVMKGLATKHHICVITTVEYRKTMLNNKAKNADISETIQIEYDASFIAHVHNELHELGDKASQIHWANVDGEQVRCPRIEINIGKNKITAFKNRLWFDFYPSSSDFVAVDERIALAEENQEIKEHHSAFGGRV